MTENEAIKDIQFLARRYDDLQEVNMSVSQESLDMAIQALEEIQQYRAIGTVEEFKALKEKSMTKKAKGIRKYDEAYCPACNEVISDGEFWALDEYVHHCNYCGQAVKGVDWQ